MPALWTLKPRNRRACQCQRGRFESDVKRIEELRNPLAHASSYAMSWDAVGALRETVRILAELRNHIKRAASKHDSKAHPGQYVSA